MKKTLQLTTEGRHPDRVLDAVKHEVRKYLKRERRRPVPGGADYWDFDCRFGLTEAEAAPVHLSALIGLIDGAARGGAGQCYVEILARPVQRQGRAAGAATDAVVEVDEG